MHISVHQLSGFIRSLLRTRVMAGTLFFPNQAGGGSPYGVIDGSDAAPGQIGEVLDAPWGGDVPVPISIEQQDSNTPTAVNSVTLSAGDWDVSAFIEWSLASSSAAAHIVFWGSLNTSVAVPDHGITTITERQDFEQAGAAIYTQRFNLTSPTPVLVLANIWSLDPADRAIAAVAAGIIHARRAR